MINLSVKSVLVSICLGLLSVLFCLLPFLLKYTFSIRRRLKQASHRFLQNTPEDPFRFVRDASLLKVRKDSGMKLLELNPIFQDTFRKEGWNLVSLGDYLTSLKPATVPPSIDPENLPIFIQEEIEAALAVALLQTLGPIMGAAILPTVGALRKPLSQLSATKAAAGFVSQFILGRAVAKQAFNDKKMGDDTGSLPLTLVNFRPWRIYMRNVWIYDTTTMKQQMWTCRPRHPWARCVWEKLRGILTLKCLF
jgi:hypothetical protein